MPYPSSALRSRLVVALACLSLAGCSPDEDPWVSRDCAGFENPNAARWMPFTSNSEGAFTNQSGEVRNVRVTKVETEPPYRETASAPDASQVNCYRRSTLTLTHSDNRVSTEWEFTNIEEQQGQPINEQRISLSVVTSVVGWVVWSYSPRYVFTLENLADPFNAGVDSSAISHSYYPRRTIDGVASNAVLEVGIQLSESRYGPQSLPEADWVRIVIARDVGLVQYELRNGQIFTRQQPSAVNGANVDSAREPPCELHAEVGSGTCIDRNGQS